MTDYEKLLEEADVTVRVLRASVPMVNADEAEMIRRLAAALREVMAERDEAQAKVRWFVEHAADEKLDGYRELGARAAKAENDRDTALAIIGKIRCVVGKAGTDDDVLDAVRSALADVEAMRADWTRAVDDIAAFLESCDDSRDDPMAYAAMEVRRRWARALDARATPPAVQWGVWCVNESTWCPAFAEPFRGTELEARREVAHWISGERANVKPGAFMYEARPVESERDARGKGRTP